MATSVAQAPTPILNFLNNAGQMNVGGRLLTQVGGVNYPTWQDAGGVTALPNPIPLNSRGEISNSSGVSVPLYLAQGVVYQFTLYDAFGNQIWVDENVVAQGYAATGQMTDEGPFIAGTNFTPGTTTSLTLVGYYGAKSNLWVQFDGASQGEDTFSLSGYTLTFNNPIPVGVQEVYVKGGTTVAVGTPGAGTVTDASISTSSNLYLHTYAWIGSKDNGATGNGTTNDTGAILAANGVAFGAGKELVITPGAYLIGTNATFTAPVRFLPGASFIIPAGITVAFNGGLKGPVAQIFSIAGIGTTGCGIVTVNAAVSPNGCAEWWGAQTGNTLIDSAPMIMAAHVALVNVNLMPGVYNTQTTVQLATSSHSLKGATPSIVAGSPVASQILINSATLDIVLMGPTTQPTTISQTNTGIFNVQLGRSTAPNVASTPAGLRVQFCIWPTIDNIFSLDSRFGYVFTGTQEAHIGTINATRMTAGVGGTDEFIAFHIDGSANIGDAGGNASLYAEKLVLGSTIAIANSQGVLADGAFGYSDTFLSRVETGNMNIGVQFVGNGNTGALDVQNEDVQIGTLILDTCNQTGILFTNTSLYGAIRVAGGFIAFNASAVNPVGIEYSGSNGSIEVTGIQVNCGTNPSATACLALNSSGINSHDNFYIECASASGVLQVNATTNSTFEDLISNNQAASASPAPAVNISNGCSRIKYDMAIRGKAGKFSVGYSLADATTSVCEFECSRINPGVLSSGTKIDNNGTAIIATGVFGTGNLASGILG